MKKIITSFVLALSTLSAQSLFACTGDVYVVGFTNDKAETLKVEVQRQDDGKTVVGGEEVTVSGGAYKQFCIAKVSTGYKVMQYGITTEQHKIASTEFTPPNYSVEVPATNPPGDSNYWEVLK